MGFYGEKAESIAILFVDILIFIVLTGVMIHIYLGTSTVRTIIPVTILLIFTPFVLFNPGNEQNKYEKSVNDIIKNI